MSQLTKLRADQDRLVQICENLNHRKLSGIELDEVMRLVRQRSQELGIAPEIIIVKALSRKPSNLSQEKK